MDLLAFSTFASSFMPPYKLLESIATRVDRNDAMNLSLLAHLHVTKRTACSSGLEHYMGQLNAPISKALLRLLLNPCQAQSASDEVLAWLGEIENELASEPTVADEEAK
jgi:hypothetical protein